jgi:hypothetical protein
VQTALQPFGVGAVDPGKPIERRQRHKPRCSAASLKSRGRGVRLATRLR